MRVRMLFVILAGVLATAACGTEAGPTPKQAPEPGIEELKIKLDALTVDECFKQAGVSSPKGCEKYTVQLGGTVGAIEKAAGTAHPNLAADARALTQAVQSYRGGGCQTQERPLPPCADALRAMAGALGRAHAAVESLPS